MKKVNLLSIAIAFIMFSGTINAQNIAISDVSHTADASAVLDVYSTTRGMLVPRLASDPSSPATGLFYYNTGTNSFKYYTGSAWKTYANTDDIYWTRNVSGELFPKTQTDFVGIGQTPPCGMLNTWLTIYDNTGTTFPQFNIIGGYTNGGDASMQYSLNGGEGPFYSHGIFDDVVGGNDYNFKICNTFTLTGPGYTDANTMMEIHGENPKAGIIDFNHQSRARVWQGPNPNPPTPPPILPPTVGQPIPTGAWTPIDFDNRSYDEHFEYLLVTPPPYSGGGAAAAAYFTATEVGYYQVNARTEFYLGGEEDLWWVAPDSYVSIAIFVSTDNGMTWNIYAQGNNLQIGQNSSWNPGPDMYPSNKYNNAPNVSDVVYLQNQHRLAIYVWQNTGMTLYLMSGNAITYCSVHKSS